MGRISANDAPNYCWTIAPFVASIYRPTPIIATIALFP
jgi:hypothetical protein